MAAASPDPGNKDQIGTRVRLASGAMWERTRSTYEAQKKHAEGYLIGFTAIVALFALWLIMYFNSSDMSSAIGLFTAFAGFLTGIVGLFFGVNNTAGRSQAAQAVAQSDESLQISNDTAKRVADSQKTADEAHAIARENKDQLTNIQSLINQSNSYEKLKNDFVTQDNLNEEFKGDPDDDIETIKFDDNQLAHEDVLSNSVLILQAANQEIDPRTLFSEQFIAVAQDQVDDGINRSSNIERVNEYLALVGCSPQDKAGNPTRYCAAGLTWAAAKAFCDLSQTPYESGRNELAVFRGALPHIREYFLPSASCARIVADAKMRGSWRPKSAIPYKGWIVFYNWNGGNIAQHVGIVINLDGSILNTIEFNTTIIVDGNQKNGGIVANKQRRLGPVIGYIATYTPHKMLDI